MRLLLCLRDFTDALEDEHCTAFKLKGDYHSICGRSKNVCISSKSPKFEDTTIRVWMVSWTMKEKYVLSEKLYFSWV